MRARLKPRNTLESWCNMLIMKLPKASPTAHSFRWFPKWRIYGVIAKGKTDSCSEFRIGEEKTSSEIIWSFRVDVIKTRNDVSSCFAGKMNTSDIILKKQKMILNQAKLDNLMERVQDYWDGRWFSIIGICRDIGPSLVSLCISSTRPCRHGSGCPSEGRSLFETISARIRGTPRLHKQQQIVF